jgi:hypothetical protein
MNHDDFKILIIHNYTHKNVLLKWIAMIFLFLTYLKRLNNVKQIKKIL